MKKLLLLISCYFMFSFSFAQQTFSSGDFIGIGKTIHVNFGEFRFELKFLDNYQMSFKSLDPNDFAIPEEIVEYTHVKLRPKLYMIFWKEKDNTTVVHVQDYAKGIVYSNITSPTQEFNNLKGKLKILK